MSFRSLLKVFAQLLLIIAIIFWILSIIGWLLSGPSFEVLTVLAAAVVSSVGTFLAHLTTSRIDRFQSDYYNDRGRERVKAWGERMYREHEWDWHLLGHALEYYTDAIRYNPTNQHPVINIAYIYHLIGKKQKAKKCLEKAHKLATPSRHYREVEKAVDTDSYISGGKVDTPEIPSWFLEKYQHRLTVDC